jgi:hypothetical protein
MISKVTVIIGGVGGFILAFAIFQLVNAVWLLPAARDEGREMERAALDAATNKAVGELSDAADRARFNRRLCVERSRVYLNATGQCIERKAEPRG